MLSDNENWCCRFTADYDSVVFLDRHEPPFTCVVEIFKQAILDTFRVEEQCIHVKGERLVPRRLKSIPLADVTADDVFVPIVEDTRYLKLKMLF